MRNGITALLALVLSCCFAPRALAEGDSEYTAAIKQAVAEFDAGNWMEARVAFKRAHELNPNARTWRSLGITAFELRRYVDAIAELEAALAEPRKPLGAKDRSDVQKLLSRARQLVAVYQVAVDPPNAEVLVDSKPAVLDGGKLYLDPGEHAVVVRAPGYIEERKDLRIDEPTQAELAIQLKLVPPVEPEEGAPPAPEAALERLPPAVAQPSSARRPRVWTWVLGGTALATTATGVGLWVAALDKHDEYARCDRGCGALKSKGQALQLGARVSYGVAGALAVGAVIAFVLEGRSAERAPSTAFFISPRSVGVSGRF